MKSLGKMDIWHRSHLNGVADGEDRPMKRTVYRDKNGDYFVNNWGGGKTKLEIMSDGKMVWNTFVTSFVSRSTEEILEDIKKKLGGAPVRIIPLF